MEMDVFSFTLFLGASLIVAVRTDDDDAFEPNSPHANSKASSASNSSPTIDVNNTDSERDTLDDIPILLWWTDSLYVHDSPFKNIMCQTLYGNRTDSAKHCYITSNRKYLSNPNTKAILFYGTDLSVEDLPLPRQCHHQWSLFHEESPMNNYMLVHGTMIKLFNYTATFRRESDFPLTLQHLPYLDYLTIRPPMPVKIKNEWRKLDTAPILYVQSHCNVASDRDRYVQELMKHVKVDSYGSCLNNKKLPDHLQDPVESMESEEFHDFIAKYKFHIAFENAICKDYITEKLFRALHVGSVPIYLGSVSINDWMPNLKSTIKATDFDSPQKLAKYILYLDSRDEEYSSYLKFKEDGMMTNRFLQNQMSSRPYSHNKDPNQDKPDFVNGFECYVCKQTSERYIIEKQHSLDPSLPLMPLKIATLDHLHCPQPYTSIGDPDNYPHSDSWKQNFYIDEYWTGFDKALAVERMLANNETDPATFEKYFMNILKRRTQI